MNPVIAPSQDSSSEPAMAGPLTGIRVVDFTTILSGPFCTRLLADMGAEVIKVEPPGGEHSRFRPPFAAERSVHYAHLNCGKMAIALDLKSPVGARVAFDLAAKADVVVENWRPGVAARLGVGYQQIAAVKPDIVYCSISGFGQQGPAAQDAAYASIVEACSGFAHAQMMINGSDTPPVSGTFLGDSLAAIWAFSAIQTALVQRGRTGRGQYLDVAMFESMLQVLINEAHEAQIGPFIRRYHRPLKTLDGHVVVPPVSGANWEALARVAGHPEWIDDPRFNTIEARNVNWFDMLDLAEGWTSQHTMRECEETLKKAGVPVARFRSVKEALDDPQLAARKATVPLGFGETTYQLPGVPFRTPGSNTRPRTRVAAVNEDLDSVLRGVLGYTRQQIDEVRASIDGKAHH